MSKADPDDITIPRSLLLEILADLEELRASRQRSEQLLERKVRIALGDVSLMPPITELKSPTGRKSTMGKRRKPSGRRR